MFIKSALRIVATLIFINGVSPAHAQNDAESNAAKQCTGDLAGDQIAGCAVIINDATWSDENHAIAFTNRGNAYARKKDYVHAFADYDKAIQLNPHYALAYLQRANRFIETNDMMHALEDDTTAIRLDPHNDEAFYNRGNVYFKMGDYPQALSDYNQAIVLNPLDGDAYNNRGEIELILGHNQNALYDYETLGHLHVDVAEAFYGHGVTLVRLRQRKAGTVDISQARKIDPGIVKFYADDGIPNPLLSNKHKKRIRN